MRKRNLLRHFDVYTDGSVNHVRQGQVRLGAGWVARENTGLYGTGSQTLSERKSGSCIVAEFMAAALALKTMPKGSHVTLHTDSKSLREFLLTGRLPVGGPGSAKRETALRTAAAELLYHAMRHILIVQPSRDKNSSDLALAHKLARNASGSHPQIR